MGSASVLLSRRALILGWVLTSVLLFTAGHWQLAQLHQDVRKHDNTLVKLRAVWHFADDHRPVFNTSSDQSTGVTEPVNQLSLATAQQQRHKPDSRTVGFSTYHRQGAVVISKASGSAAGAASSSSSAQDIAKATLQHTGASSMQQAVQPHPQPVTEGAVVTDSSTSSSASRKGGLFLPHLSDGQGNTVPPQQLSKKPSSEGSQKPRSSSGSNSSSSSSSSSSSAASSTAGQSPSAAAPVSSSSSSVSNASSLLAPVLTASDRAHKDPVYRQKLEEAASKPINIAVMTGLFWQLPVSHTQGCQVDGIPLDCHIQNGGTKDFLDKADALYYHVPSFGGKPRAKAFPHQLRLAMSLESAAYYANLDNPSFMCHFDAEMTYRTCAQVTNWYSLESYDKLFQEPPVPIEEKLHAIAYVNSNCGAQSGRSEIMRKLIALGKNAKVPVHALGRCDNNTPWPPGRPHKVEVMRKYKFCVAMENSVRQDYMTEKMWDALAAGCIPIYLGSSNAPHIIPDPNSVIMYDASGKTGHASTPEQLDAVMHDIGSNKQRYEAMVAWKTRKPEDQPSEIFRYLWGQRGTTGECFLCQFLARHRAEPQERYTTCLFNKDWMASAGQRYAPWEQFCHDKSATN